MCACVCWDFSRYDVRVRRPWYVPEPAELRSLNIITKVAFQEFGFEPYGKGVIAFAKFPENAVGRGQVSQISTYCKDGVPYLLLSREKWHPRYGDVAKELVKHQSGFTISREDHTGSIVYGPNSVTVRTGGKPIAEIRLDNQGALLLTQKSIGWIDVAAMHGIYNFLVNPSQEDIKKIEASFRLCMS